MWAKAAGDPEEGGTQNVESEFIVSEKDEVELVKDSNVSEAIQRRPDLSFSNVTIDGEGSRQSLDSISAEDVTSVEVLKAVTPDQDADSRGGSIRLKTRPSYTQKGISTKIMLESEYRSYVEEIGYEGSISVGGPLNELRTIGGRLTFSYEDETRGDQYINKDWFRRTVDGESKLALRELNLNDIREWNTDRDITAALDLKANESLRFLWKGSHSLYRNHEKRPQLEYRFNKGSYAAIDPNGASIEGFEVERGLYEYENEYEVAETTLGSEWEEGDWEADLKLVYQEDTYQPIDYFNVDFVSPDVDATYDLDSYLFPTVTIDNGGSIDDSSQFASRGFYYPGSQSWRNGYHRICKLEMEKRLQQREAFASNRGEKQAKRLRYFQRNRLLRRLQRVAANSSGCGVDGQWHQSYQRPLSVWPRRRQGGT